ncbi:stage II sporulation protein R [Oceanobacillus profundus]|uniref:Stage II sporulation protein R n=1 Tax=Oceanobacillus profundus TaxID=372463 RepID=A0A417YPG5_9BACI|nr:stage II sporulation protein R [Oceanobacillus profundus]MCM3398840.1 stage II sporulation protein R [Oceanobacillus profundus]MDO6450083.1 stage II sporulation protein R [Oceanobacillus profundus]PAE30588.1 stage II sporulation protein R [Paenibacillus sp. 7884-2]RHW35443.1 stage II sporulation protein R [Oceanobacillus profundus]
MKKLVFFVLICFVLYFSLPLNGVSKELKNEEDYQVIPDEAIRLRILANSDNEQDQALKLEVRDRVNEVVTEWVQHITDIDEARALIESRIPELEQIVKSTIDEQGTENDYSVEYGKNITFPAKLYGSFLYPAGEYEAILITLGEGNGSNWWCVLFPPLCFLDFSGGTTVAEAADADTVVEEEVEEEETEIKFFLFEWFGWS